MLQGHRICGDQRSDQYDQRCSADVQTIGILYTSSEANSEIQANEAVAAAEELGLETVVATSSNTNDIPQVMASVVGSVDAVIFRRTMALPARWVL